MSAPWHVRALGLRVVDLMRPASTSGLPPELIRLDADTAVVVTDIDGTDLLLTVSLVPKPRSRKDAQ